MAFQPMMRGRSWRLSIEGQRLDIKDLLDDNPSLGPIVSQSIGQAWRRALLEAEKEPGLERSQFPALCPWDPASVQDNDFWPE
jgi:hypothetical protein